MLIRSQDKMSLTNMLQVTDLIIDKSHDGLFYDIVAIYTHSVMTLGRYKTKEQAVAVLDEIQNAYQYLMECKYMGIGSSQPEFIFVMPKDIWS